MAEKPHLLLLRHADAGDPSAWTRPDAERPLSPKGIDQAERVARRLRAEGPRPGRIETSPKVRARQTAEIVGRALGLEPGIGEWLAGGYGLADIAARIGPEARGATMLVGHDPELSAVLGEMLGRRARLRKGRLAVIAWSGALRPGTARLLELIDPASIEEP